MSGAIPLPSREEAEGLLRWAQGKNPGPWVSHSQVVARAAETIAKTAGLDVDRAYISGLLHDVGRYEGVRGLHHVYAGYELLKGKGHDTLAEICLSHSFPYQDLDAFSGGDYDCTAEELTVITSYLAAAVYSDYDKLIQLCDGLGTAQGVCLMEKRLLDVTRRYGFNGFTVKKWNAFFSLKCYFDQLAACNIYDLFYDEIREVTFS